ncbi:Major facilitator superfamily transporter [Cordyceps fumosorosea ARSEF 2679]|uniref:Major facilitator superfamily transporter n=1 Tax=Cordyceps fumosorosea (strain ARSEF 2679) TaxID=1081104 RepID=A0A162LLD5_CORFA|nr:Major facilitator superfamily transporter [Cordyceps fumosorosea ARSEF 2679]OAA72314.1 Major facilitator superfamily transporter [Cordyceps fumosorosea ARSEF 2679]
MSLLRGANGSASAEHVATHHHHHHHHDGDETTPLLATTSLLSGVAIEDDPEAGCHGGGDDDDRRPAPQEKPLPALQIALLCYARIMEPIAFFAIVPYIAAMVSRAGRLPASDVGFYSGLIESLFSAVQVCVLIAWGRLADRLGRRPVLLASLAGMAVGPALFGLATSIPQMILFRCVAGVFSGSTLIIRTMIADHCAGGGHGPRAFSWFAFAGNVGILIGPIIGGLLADPAEQYPGWFGGSTFLRRFPYAAPGFAVSAIAVTGVVACFFFLEETLDKTTAHATTGPQKSLAGRITIWRLLKTSGVPTVLLVNGSVMIMAFAFTALLPVVLYTPIAIGGLGLSAFQISMYMALQGLSQAAWLLLAFPPLHRRLGNRRLLLACAVAYPFFFLSYIILNELLRARATGWAWGVGPLAAAVGPGVSMAFTGVQLALNDASPDPRVMGTLNGIALTVASALRSFVPALTTVLYAVGVREQVLRGHLAWAVLIPVSALMLVAIPKLPDDRPATTTVASAASDEESNP